MATANPALFMALSAKLDGGVSTAFAQFERQARAAGAAGARGMNQTSEAAANTERRLRAAAAGLAAFQGPLGGIASRVSALAQLFGTLGTVSASVIGGLASGAALIGAASEIQNFQAKLKAATESQAEFATAQLLTSKAANDSRSSLDDTIKFYVRLAAATRESDISQQELVRTLTTVQKSIQLSGSGAQEAGAAMIQFSQAIGSASGLSGDEFKSLGENAVVVLQAIADGLKQTNAIPGFDGTIGALRRLGKEGQLTQDVLLPALAAVADTIDARFARMPLTIQQSLNLFKTTFSEFVIRTNEATGVLDGAASGIALVSRNFDVIGGAAVAAGAAITARFVVPLTASTAASVAGGARLLALSAGIGATGIAARTAGPGITALGLQEGALVRVMQSANLTATQQAALLLTLRTSAISGAGGIGVLNTAMLTGRVAATGIGGALGSIVTLLGGPWGVAFAGAAAAAFYLATRQDEVAAAAQRMGISEDDLAARVRAATGEINAQNNALADTLAKYQAVKRAQADKEVGATGDLTASKRGDLLRSLQETGAGAALAPRDYGRLRSLLLGGASFPQIAKEFDALAAKNAEFGRRIVADRDLIDRKILDRKPVAEVLADVGRADELYFEALRRRAGLDKPAEAVATNRSSGALSKALAGAQARLLALGATTKSVEAAAARQALALAKLDIEFKGEIKKGQIADAEKAIEYQTRRNQIAELYQGEIDAIKAAKKADADRRQAAKTAAREEKDEDRERRQAVEADERFRQQALDRRQQIEQRNNRQPRALDTAANDREELLLQLARGYVGLDEYNRLNASIADKLLEPMREFTAEAETQRALQDLALSGRDLEAEVLSRSLDIARRRGQITEEEVAQIGAVVEAERERSRLLRARDQAVDQSAQLFGSVQSSFEGLFAGGGGANFARSLGSAFNTAFAKRLSTSLFGDAEQDRRDELNGALGRNADSTEALTAKINDLISAVSGTTSAIGGLPSLTGEAFSDALQGGAANDNLLKPGVIPGVAGSASSILSSAFAGIDTSLKATKQTSQLLEQVIGPTARKRGGLFGEITSGFGAEVGERFGAKIGDRLDRIFGTGQRDGNGGRISGGGTFGRIAGGVGSLIGAAGEGAAFGNALASITDALGIGGNAQGAQAGGAIGRLLGGPIGETIGSIIGLLVKITPRAFTNLTTNASGEIETSSGGRRGNNKDQLAAQSKQLASSLTDAIASITSALGGSLQANAVLGAIGPANGRFEVKTNPTDVNGYGTGGQTLVFDTAEEAVAGALKSFVERGIIKGLRDSTRRLLLAGQDFERQLTKAGKFEGAFRELRGILDPVGLAVDDLNTRFTELRDIAVEAGATAEEYGKIQQLYDLQRAETINKTDTALAGLRDYLTELTTGSSTGLSARDRQGAALAAFSPLASDISAGKTVDFDAFRSASETLLGIDRELYGSTQTYFDRLAEITDLTRRAISDRENVTSIADALKIANTPVTQSIDAMSAAVVGSIEDNNALLSNVLANFLSGGVVQVAGGQAAIRGF